ncbi:MAG: hypothetical protein WBC91_08920 [Phototrophicaceae bacterium]
MSDGLHLFWRAMRSGMLCAFYDTPPRLRNRNRSAFLEAIAL